MAEQPLTTVKVLPEEMSGLQNMALDIPSQDMRQLGMVGLTGTHLTGVAGNVMQIPGIEGDLPYAGLPANMNPWPEVYFSGLTYGGEGMDRLTGVRKTMHDAELQVQRERLLAAQQIRTLQELLARERLNFQAVTTKNKAEKEELEGKIPPLQRIIEELNAKIKENQAEIKKWMDMVPPRDEEILKLKGLLENEQKLRDTAERTLDFERKGADEKIVNLERGLQLEKDALAELRHAKEKEREAAAAKEIALADAIEVERRQIEALEAQAKHADGAQKLSAMEADEKIRLLKKKIDEDAAAVIEAQAKMQSARDLFEGEKEALELQLSTEKGKVKGLQALQGADAADMEKKCRMIEDALGAERAKTFETKTKLEGEKTAFGRDVLRLQDLLERERGRVSELEDRLELERIRLSKEIAVGKEDLDLEKKKLLNATNRDQKDLHLLAKEKHELTLLLEKEKNKRLDSEKRLEGDRANFDKLKLDFEARIDTFRNRNTDIEDELRREIATLQKLIETLREQVTFERKRREVHDVNVASKTTTELVTGAMAKGADRFSATSKAGLSKHL
jgi:hypothetical protein